MKNKSSRSPGFVGSEGLARRAAGFSLRLLSSAAPVVYHTAVIALSAALAFSLPSAMNRATEYFWTYWPLIENEKLLLFSLEIVVAILLIVLFNDIRRSWIDRKLAKMAMAAGMVYVTRRRGPMTRRQIRALKEKQGLGREVMVIGSTGFRTLIDPRGDLHAVIRNCREAKIMLLNPHAEGAIDRAKSLLDPDITLERLREQVVTSIAFLKELNEARKHIALKLYPDAPLLKLAVLSDYVWVQHYHAGMDVQHLPEYAFRNEQHPGSLYTFFYQCFLARWKNPTIPEYDLYTDELVYRDQSGREMRRGRFSTDLDTADPSLRIPGEAVQDHQWGR